LDLTTLPGRFAGVFSAELPAESLVADLAVLGLGEGFALVTKDRAFGPFPSEESALSFAEAARASRPVWWTA